MKGTFSFKSVLIALCATTSGMAMALPENTEEALSFVAPVVYDATNNYPNEQAGSIVYDSLTGNFFGMNHDHAWLQLGFVTGQTTVVKVCNVYDEKSAGTSGGNSGGSPNTWTTRTLNTVDPQGDDCSSFLTLSSDTMTLIPGDYDIECSAPAYNMDYHKVRLVLSSNGSKVIDGTSEFNNSGSLVQTRSFLRGRLSPTGAPTGYKLEHFLQNASVTNGLGRGNATQGNPERFAECKITKINL